MGYKLSKIYVGTNLVWAQYIKTAGIYYNSSLGLISLSSDGNTRITIADKNLGATTVYNNGDTLSEANCGKYYQWGNNYGFPRTGSVTTSSTQVNASSYGPGNYYSRNIFVNNSSGWDSSNNANLWGGTTGTAEAMQGPCASGFHIASQTERNTLYNVGVSLGVRTSSSGNPIKTYLKMPYAGYRYRGSGAVSNQGGYALYRSSTWATSPKAWSFEGNSSSLKANGSENGAEGMSIRPFKNVAVQPRQGTERVKLN